MQGMRLVPHLLYANWCGISKLNGLCIGLVFGLESPI